MQADNQLQKKVVNYYIFDEDGNFLTNYDMIHILLLSQEKMQYHNETFQKYFIHDWNLFYLKKIKANRY